jgi:hypothetical protein
MKKFLKGVLFISFLLPVINEIITLISQFNQYLCTIITYWTYQLQQNIQSSDQKNDSVIGFQIPNILNEEDDEEGE